FLSARSWHDGKASSFWPEDNELPPRTTGRRGLRTKELTQSLAGSAAVSWVAVKRGEAEPNHLVERRLWSLVILHHQPWMAVADPGGFDQMRGNGRVARTELSCRHAACDNLLNDCGHAPVVLVHDRPVFGDRDFNQLMQLTVAHVALMVRPFHGCKQVLEPL